MLWDKIDSLVLRNFHDYWEDPLINKYLVKEASKHFEGILIVRKGKKPIWISHPFNYTQAKKSFSKKAIVLKYNTIEEIKTILQNKAGKVIGYNPRHQTIVSFRNLKKFLPRRKFVDVEEELEEERQIKNKSEIKNISKAVKETKKVLAQAESWVHKGITEKELEEKIRLQFLEDGFETAFCIVAFEENTSHIHHVSSDKKLNQGVVLIDTGAKYNGYCADLTRTFWFGTEKGPLYDEFHQEKIMAEDCLKKIESKLKPGTMAKDLCRCTNLLEEMPHSLGHGIGIEVHDFPSGIGHKSKWKLREGMVLAIEPAEYKKKFGIRIEDNYLITKKGFRKL
ncbi:MAG: Xaa-Pro peptidase family protein [archaeon]|jgi:Xaa-Pro aminopeptidase